MLSSEATDERTKYRPADGRNTPYRDTICPSLGSIHVANGCATRCKHGRPDESYWISLLTNSRVNHGRRLGTLTRKEPKRQQHGEIPGIYDGKLKDYKRNQGPYVNRIPANLWDLRHWCPDQRAKTISGDEECQPKSSLVARKLAR